MRKIFAIILFILVLVVSTVFALNNDQLTSVNYLFGSTELALSLIVFWAALCGLILGILGMVFAVYKLKHRLNRTQKQLNKLNKEVQHLRQQSVVGREPF